MRSVLIIIIFLSIFVSCNIVKSRPYSDIGSDFYYEDNCKKNQGIDIYRSSINNKKLKGNIIRKTVDYYDSTLNFIYHSNFSNGLLNGSDSIFKNDELLMVANYREGVKQGEQIEFHDSIKLISYYINGVIQGYQNTYHNGILYKRSFFNHGIKDSLECYYESLGEIVTTIKYHYSQDEDVYWHKHLNLDNYELVSIYRDKNLPFEILKQADYKGTIVYNSYDSKDVANPRIRDVVHESVTQNSSCENKIQYYGYFYIIDENDCIVCDYIDHDGIWVAYFNLFSEEIEYFELKEKN